MGFKEIPHTADWAVRVWADDLRGLLVESARAMNTLTGIVFSQGPRTERAFDLEGVDEESLLVMFLSELVYLQEQEGLGFDQFDIQIAGHDLKAKMDGARIASVDKAIKAVTWHNLKIEKTARGLEAEITFDV